VNMIFRAASPVTLALCEEASRLDPSNPMLTWRYVQAMIKTGCQPVMLGLSEDGRWAAAALAFIRIGKLIRELELVSLPRLPEAEVFWKGLLGYCRQWHISQLSVYTFGTSETAIPALPGETHRTQRSEFVIDLPGADLMAQMTATHRQRVRRGEKAGLRLRRTSDPAECVQHLRVNRASLDRRAERGEKVEVIGDAFIRAALDSESAEIFQAVLGDQVLSSAVILRAPRGAYLHASGTSQEGMKIGASHFLNFQIASTLQAENCELYNLGGASSRERGLWDYKTHFGARRIDLEAVECYLGAPWKRKMSTALRLVRQNPRGLVEPLCGRIEHWRVFAAAVERLTLPAWPEGYCFRRLSENDFESLAMPDEFRADQKNRLTRMPAAAAYGVIQNGVLAHVSWALVSTQETPRHLGLRDREAEISGCETLPEFRGRGLYPLAIRSIADHLKHEGIRTVFMKTIPSNTASQKGISKAGLVACGRVIAWVLPLSPPRNLILRLFRRL
jgi:ribosomal protein S18 acetylase RimI-like enzyme